MRQLTAAASVNDKPARPDGLFDRDGTLPVNLSGGLLGHGAPVGATGVAQVATCALLLEGRYHNGLQPSRPFRTAMADTHGGVGTTCAVTILHTGMAT